ncbi:hypothetical protein ACK389_01635 [Streptomyces antibioticus]|uniref:Uncharacterized protein n=1 Tax=Streptomyces antibioticus TaxID=1890 RepID=A0AAE7CP08_STRAT|nr:MULTISPECIES: hypothetical protein [Streptomyces]MBO7936181.1 hypothetical protein [Streptomyces sp. S9]MCX5173328.1 hypothetical protein [Streptomyces antibioticus]NUV58160.1 hypothetical protein [Streptomyces sp. CAI-85]QIT48335.1 hypothetical protein HCX60_36410 [Streptomyces antibioticus]
MRHRLPGADLPDPVRAWQGQLMMTHVKAFVTLCTDGAKAEAGVSS